MIQERVDEKKTGGIDLYFRSQHITEYLKNDSN